MTNSIQEELQEPKVLARLKDELRGLKLLEPLRGSSQHDRMLVVEQLLSEAEALQPSPVI